LKRATDVERRGPGSIARRLALAGVSLVLAFLVGEGIVRLALPELGAHPSRDFSLGWSTPEYRAFDPLEGERREGVPRVLVLGDSYLGQSYINRGVDCRFPAAAQRELGDAVETRVLAAGGWGTDQELLAFLQKGKAWKPDVVVLAFCANNDLMDNLTNNGRGTDKPYFVLDDDGGLTLYDPYGAPRPEVLTSTGEAWARSYLVDLFRVSLLAAGSERTAAADSTFADVDPRYLLKRGARDGVDAADGEAVADEAAGLSGRGFRRAEDLDWSPQLGNSFLAAYLGGDHELISYQWRLFEALVGELHRHTEEIRAELVLMLVPVTLVPRDVEMVVGSDLEYEFDTPDGPVTFRTSESCDRLAGIAERAGIRFWNPASEFVEEVVDRDLVEACWPKPGDRHFSRVGHSVLAGLFSRFLREEHGIGQ
jgi:hypothetical protein